MVGVGDRIRLTLNKGAARDGTVTGVTGSMLRVRWGSGDETTVIPGPGTLTVLGRTARKASPGKRAGVKRGAGDRVPGRTTSPKPAAAKKKATAPQQGASKRPSQSKERGRGHQPRG